MTKTLKHQFDTLVLEPLVRLRLDRQNPSIIVVVVNALNEEDDVRTMNCLFSQARRLSLVRLKFFLISRLELLIRLGFEGIVGSNKASALHQIPEAIIELDISTFLRHKLARIRKDYNKSVRIPWIRKFVPLHEGQNESGTNNQISIFN